MAMQEFIEYAVKGLVDDAEAVAVTPIERHGMTIYELRVAPDDVGKIIGRRGATIQALRALLQAGAMKAGVRCQLELVED